MYNVSPCYIIIGRWSTSRGGLGRLVSRHLSGGPVGPLAMRAATSICWTGSGTEEGARGPLTTKGRLSSDKIFSGVPEFLATTLFIGLVCLIGQDRFKEPERPCRLGKKGVAVS